MNTTGKNEPLHKRLRELRIKQGLNVRELAQRIGVPESTYREWEYGRPMTGPPFVRIAQSLSVPLTYLMTGEAAEAEWLLSEMTEIETRLAQLRSRLASRI